MQQSHSPELTKTIFPFGQKIKKILIFKNFIHQ
jgi:hypothetical protein